MRVGTTRVLLWLRVVLVKPKRGLLDRACKIHVQHGLPSAAPASRDGDGARPPAGRPPLAPRYFKG